MSVYPSMTPVTPRAESGPVPRMIRSPPATKADVVHVHWSIATTAPQAYEFVTFKYSCSEPRGVMIKAIGVGPLLLAQPPDPRLEVSVGRLAAQGLDDRDRHVRVGEEQVAMLVLHRTAQSFPLLDC